MTQVVPYVVGQWVRGPRFYGRHALITEILDGPRDSLWVAGTRRIGKTSLLKQLELIAADGEQGYVPLFWDLQGAESAEELAEGFADALADAEQTLGRLGIELAGLETQGDLLATLSALRRRIRARGLKLLLLCDEVEELLGVRERDPALLRKLRRAFHAQEGIRTVLAASIRLEALADAGEETSPFLHGFSPPLFLRRLAEDDARALVCQTHLAPDQRPDLGAQTVAAICGRCDHHPYLLQLVAKRTLEAGDLDEACERVVADSTVSAFFAADFALLGEEERRVLSYLADELGVPAEGIGREVALGAQTAGILHRLENLGFVHRDAQRRYALHSFFLRRWLTAMAAPAPPREPVRERGEDPSPRRPAPEVFHLPPWRIEPRLNRLEGAGREAHLEPKVMDLLVFLARRAGEVVSKDEILDAVWESRFVTDSTLSRAIADLRKALDDDARRPKFIETISKRGYRLLSAVVWETATAVGSRSSATSPSG